MQGNRRDQLQATEELSPTEKWRLFPHGLFSCVQVVMRSGDAELEMRGRCSAGQKVPAITLLLLDLASYPGARYVCVDTTRYSLFLISFSVALDHFSFRTETLLTV